MTKNETIIDKADLFDYLDQYGFVNDEEIQMAICEYIEKQEGALYWSDTLLASELSEEYIKAKNLKFISFKNLSFN